ncbi:DUF2259 domain-containing protein [Mesorhizobium sp. B4-1-1]|uniref:DUF2259 domain-containing protein n=1 Tax=Mesorhizobium sp. B4-1-1 TaxID=2589890 RepID=UPI002484C454|nr:DUF2259 domain-containing protein [Mesorhizobium sp. B4-1-1]
MLHKAVPGSRNCPTSYSLSEVYEFAPKGKPVAIAVLVQRFSPGFEGRGRHLMAATGQLPRSPRSGRTDKGQTILPLSRESAVYAWSAMSAGLER